MKLSIVIPAYNEEEAIAGILTRCLAAREPIKKATGLDVEIVAVDDGSRDKTRQIASGFKDAKLVVHEVNRGYGQALMTGFLAGSGDYLGFLDADGTCDPLAFIDLYSALKSQGADMAVGNRLHEKSQMPAVRRLGNRIYAAIITALTGARVSDSASGMRLFARDLIDRLEPLPTGLHFTPAMTARVASMGRRIAETPIPYAERQGQSKLNVVVDGLRFLRVILGIIFAYFPLRFFGPVWAAFWLLALGLGVQPVLFYAGSGFLKEDMIYRLLTIVTLSVCGLVSLAFGLVSQNIADFVLGRKPTWVPPAEPTAAVGGLLSLGGVLLNSKTILEYASSGRITIHWVYVLTGGLAVILGTVLFCFGVTLALVRHLPTGGRK